MNRLKNYGLWLSIFAFIPMFLQAFKIDILPDSYSQLVNSFLGILVVAGILNNPNTSNNGYLDDKQDITAPPQSNDKITK